MNTVLDVVTLVVVGVGVLVAFLVRRGLEAATTKSTELAVQEALDKVNWPSVLARELEKTRGTQRQGLRFVAYGRLWEKMRPLAVYDESLVNGETMAELSEDLSDWYYSACGGLMLTNQARGLYFALQDLLRGVADSTNWEAERPGSRISAEGRFREIAEGHYKGAVAMLDYMKGADAADWSVAQPPVEGWRADIKTMALPSTWEAFSPQDRFVIIQQVSSALRSCLTMDVESRLR